MRVFEIANSNVTGNLSLQCRNIIKNYRTKGMFDPNEIIKGEDKEYTSIYFILSQDCNLDCRYCYQPKEFRQKNTPMSKEIIDSTMDWVFRTFDEKKVKFSLFGGEPFLNFEMIKYMVESYPMMRFVVTTNGYALCQSKEMRDFVLTHRHNLKLSVSISALKQKFGNEFLTKAAPVIDLLKANGGDIHFVVDNPEDERVYEEIIYLYEQNVPVVRVSSARHWDLVRDKWPQYLDLFKRISDYLYFSGEPKFGRSQWDAVFRNNIYRFYKGIPLKPTPPTFCGCGYMYLAVDKQGDIYPCDFFANFPEFKIGDIYSGINETAILFKRMSEWIEDLYEGCKGCEVVPNGDIRLCPRAMCLAENYMVTGNPLLPAKNHCWANRIEFGNYSYIAQRAIKEGIDKVFLR